jgi:hypothetical protein
MRFSRYEDEAWPPLGQRNEEAVKRFRKKFGARPRSGARPQRPAGPANLKTIRRQGKS